MAEFCAGRYGSVVRVGQLRAFPIAMKRRICPVRDQRCFKTPTLILVFASAGWFHVNDAREPIAITNLAPRVPITCSVMAPPAGLVGRDSSGSTWRVATTRDGKARAHQDALRQIERARKRHGCIGISVDEDAAQIARYRGYGEIRGYRNTLAVDRNVERAAAQSRPGQKLHGHRIEIRRELRALRVGIVCGSGRCETRGRCRTGRRERDAAVAGASRGIDTNDILAAGGSAGARLIDFFDIGEQRKDGGLRFDTHCERERCERGCDERGFDECGRSRALSVFG